MNKILVPVDFSEHSEYALEVAAALAKQIKAELVVFHMLGLSQMAYWKEDSEELAFNYYKSLAKKKLKKFLDRDYLKGVKVSKIIQNYTIFSKINTKAQEQKIDLIVMGSHGTSLTSGFFVGSNTEKVVRTSEVPVLVIKKQMADFKIRNAVFACDFKMENMEPYLEAIKMFDLLGAKVNLLYVNLPNERYKSTVEMEKLVRDFMNIAHKGNTKIKEKVAYISAYSVEEGVFGYSNRIHADLIAIPTHGRRGLAHFFNRSLGESVANLANLPVMTFKMPFI